MQYRKYFNNISIHREGVFSPYKGSRQNVKKILIVITDGRSTDRENLPAALKLVEDNDITRFSVGVSVIWVLFLW